LSFRLVLEGGAVLEGRGPVERRGDLIFFRLPDGRPVSLEAERVVEVVPLLARPESGERPERSVSRSESAATRGTVVYTNENLPALPDDPPSSVSIPDGERDWAEGLDPLGYEGYLDRNGNGEAWWRHRADSLREALAAAEVEVLYAERRLAAMGQLILQLSGPGGLPTPLGSELARARQEYEATVEWRDSLRLSWKDLREEARVAGALPGWLR
jgi:hypothetical protein